jgi:uncharacterized repeat protein (TIGR01451 family)
MRNTCLALLVCCMVFVGSDLRAQASAPELKLKWKKGGCQDSTCQWGWHVSPAVADLDGDGRNEVVWASYGIWVLDSATGATKWMVQGGHDRSEPGAKNEGRDFSAGVVMADIDHDGQQEFITGHKGGYISVYSHDGYFKPGWPQRPYTDEVYGLAAYDLDGDGYLEIIATYGRSSRYNNFWVYRYDGTKYAPGWPQLSDGVSSWGTWNTDVAVGDLNKDGRGEIVVTTDNNRINAFKDDASRIPVSSIYGASKVWNEVAIFENLSTSIKGWGTCGVDHNTNFGRSGPIIADLDGDGTNEVVAIADVDANNCSGTSPVLYAAPYVVNADQSRFNRSGFDWTSWVKTGPPLLDDDTKMSNTMRNVVPADIDGDGRQEILYPSDDGKLHCFWLDKTEHFNWPYSVYKAGDGAYQYPSEPVVADIDNDGKAEIIFGSYSQWNKNVPGKLTILNSEGNLINEVSIPPGADGWNGVMGAPTLAHLDNEADLDVIVGTARSGVWAFDLTNSANARILWGTGRGNQQRTGSWLTPPLPTLKATATVDRTVTHAGDTLHYAVSLSLLGGSATGVLVTDTLPSQVTYAGALTASSGDASAGGASVLWTGAITNGQSVSIGFNATVNDVGDQPTALVNQVTINAPGLSPIVRSAISFVDPRSVFAPLILR